MRSHRALLLVVLGVAACATPGQVRRVETQVQLADHERARSDSAQRSELARIQIMQRQDVDSMSTLVHQLNEAIQRLSRESVSNFEDMKQRLYQVASLSNTTVASLNKLSNNVSLGLSNPAPTGTAPTTPGSDSARAATSVIPPAENLLTFARDAISQTAYPAARRSLNQLLVSYPQDPRASDATYLIGYTFEKEVPDSARVYYNRVWTAYPKADKAPTALYKLGNMEFAAGNLPAARKYWQQIVKDYPNSLESGPAGDRLRENP